MSEDYLEINLSRRALRWILAAAALLILISLSVLGRFHTPDPPHVIWWEDWTQWKVEHRYRQELARMKGDLAELAETLQGRPDPVRAELAAARMEQRYTSGLGLLEGQREVAIGAALAVRDWAAGYGTYDAAVEAVNQALDIVEKSEHHVGGSDGQAGVQKDTTRDAETDPASFDTSTEDDWWTDSQ
jgi:hypothetical protein